MENPGAKARPCPRCGALNGAGFDRCIRCAAPLQALAAGAEALGSSINASINGRKLWGTKLIVALTALVFAGQLSVLLQSDPSKALFSGGTARDMLRFGAMFISLDEAQAEPFRLLSAVFVHFGVLHFAMNMMSLVNVGRVVEPGIGPSRFIVAYLVAGVLGFALNLGVEAVFPHRGPVPVLTAGASGAVMGAMGLVLGWLIRMRDPRWRGFAVQAVFFAVVMNFLGMSVNNGAHFGGLLCGVAFGLYFASYPRPRSMLVANLGAIAGLVLTVLSLVLAQRAANWGKRPAPIGAPADTPSGHAGAAKGPAAPGEMLQSPRT